VNETLGTRRFGAFTGRERNAWNPAFRHVHVA
jgi:hypothetical protein